MLFSSSHHSSVAHCGEPHPDGGASVDGEGAGAEVVPGGLVGPVPDSY